MDWNMYVRSKYSLHTHLVVSRDAFQWLIVIETMSDMDEAQRLVQALEPYRVTHDHPAVVVPKPGSPAEWAMTADDDLPF